MPLLKILPSLISQGSFTGSFSGTSSYARRSLTASYALNASGGGGSGTSGTAGSSGQSGAAGTSGTAGSSGASGAAGTSGTSGTGSPGSSGTSGTSVSTTGTTNRLVKFTSASTIGNTSTVHESGSAFLGIGVSSSLVSKLQVYRSGSNLSVLKVDGGSGTLFEVTDALSGSLFNVNDITGLPILEVFSNNKIVAGTYGSNALVVSGSSVGIGTSVPKAKLHVIGNISGSQFTSSRTNAVGFFGTSSYARRALTASYALNASGGGGSGTSGTAGSSGQSGAAGTSGTSGTGSPGSSGTSGTSVSVSGTTNRLVKFTGTSTIGGTSTVYESGSAFLGIGVSSSLISKLQVYRSGSNLSVLKVDGGSGTLFEVTDALSGSLFNVNTIAGLPVLEVFSNNKIVAGTYGSNALVVSGSSVGIGTAVPNAKLHIIGNISGSSFTSSKLNKIGFFGTSSYSRRSLTASYALNASGGGGGGSTLRTGSTYPITASKTTSIGAGTTNRLVKYTNASSVGQSFTPIFESGSAFIGIGPISASLISRLQVYRSGSNLSVLKVDGGSGTLFEVTDALSGSLFNVNTIAGLPVLEVFSNNKIVMGTYGSNALVVSGSSVGVGTATPTYKLEVNGSFGATSKSFLIKHPDPNKSDKYLQHGVTEAPEHTVFVRGKLTNNNIIELPDYWPYLVDDTTITVTITPIESYQQLYVQSIQSNKVIIANNNNTAINCYYYVVGERKDIPKLIVEL